MKKVSIILTLLSFSANYLLAQKANKIIGIFRTEIDFQNKVSSYPMQSQEPHSKISLNDLFKSKFITLKTQGSKVKIAKDSLYGFQVVDKSIYRFQNNEVYKFVDTSTSICIYYLSLLNRQIGQTNVTSYYYSYGYQGEIKKLSIKNLLDDFDTNKVFCEALVTKFKYNTELIEIDECTNKYKVLSLIQTYLN